MPSLVHLEVANNKIATLPEDVCLLTALKTLDVYVSDGRPGRPKCDTMYIEHDTHYKHNAL